jgi:hypothetical protein
MTMVVKLVESVQSGSFTNRDDCVKMPAQRLVAVRALGYGDSNITRTIGKRILVAMSRMCEKVARQAGVSAAR